MISFKEFLVEKNNSAVKGLHAEKSLVNHLKQHGLMDKSSAAAGNSGGNDFHIKRKSGEKYLGKEHDTYQGESKSGRAEFGRMNLAHTHEKGWHIPEKTKAKKPNLAKSIEKSTVKGMPLLDYMNKHHKKFS